MTWRELKNFINKQARNNKDFLDNEVKLYDYDDGGEHEVSLTELLFCMEDEVENENSNWVPYLSINDEEQNDETETKEASID